MSENSFVTYLAKTGSKLINDIALKHEGGEFLPEITLKNPHLHKRKQELLKSYCDLLIGISDIFRAYETCKKEAKIELRKWSKTLKFNKSLEIKLYFDSFIEGGGDHG